MDKQSILNKQFERHRIVVAGQVQKPYEKYDIAMMLELCGDCMDDYVKGPEAEIKRLNNKLQEWEDDNKAYQNSR